MPKTKAYPGIRIGFYFLDQFRFTQVPFSRDHLSQEVIKKEETTKKEEKTKPMEGQANGKAATEGTELVRHKHRDCTFLLNVAVKCGV